jgi:hypothetical protein
MLPPVLDLRFVAFDLLAAGQRLAGESPLLIVNEPIFRSTGRNSDLHYNFFYPRWAYDQYRQNMLRLSEEADWFYLDAWNLIDPSDFTNSAIHYNPTGSKKLAKAILDAILSIETHR